MISVTPNKHKYLSNWSILSPDGTLAGATTLRQSKLSNNGNKGVLHTSQSSRTETSDAVYCHIQDIWKMREACMPFSRASAQSGMQTVPSRIWTWIAKSISYTDNHYIIPFFFSQMSVWNSNKCLQLCTPWLQTINTYKQ